MPYVRRANSLHVNLTAAALAAGTLLSFGRPTYGRLGQKDADVAADAGRQAGAAG